MRGTRTLDAAAPAAAPGGASGEASPPGIDSDAAFRRGMLAHIPHLRAYAISLSRSHVEADDLVQEALLKAWRARDSFQPGTNLQAWLFTILRNAFLSEAVIRNRTTQDVNGGHASRLASSPNQEWRLQYGEMLEALQRLRPHGREALLLVVGSGLSYEEAAKVCNCPVNTMKSRVKRARATLAELIDFQLSAPGEPEV